MTAETLFQVISQGLTLINKLVPDQAVKIQEQLNDYKTQWDAEFAKGPSRDDSKLDYLDGQLCDIGKLYLAAINSAASQSKS